VPEHIACIRDGDDGRHDGGGSRYAVTAANTVSLVKAKSRKSFTVPAAVSISGKTFKDLHQKERW
jgi:hypothetical protein